MNILLDGSFLLHQTYHVLKSIRAAQGKEFSPADETDRLDFQKKYLMDLNKIRKIVDETGRFIICLDSYSWRKEYSAGYKASRKKDESVKEHWNNVYSMWDETIEKIRVAGYDQGIYTSKSEGLEADDLLYLWSDYFFKNGENTLIVGNDNDLIQLVRYSEEKKNFVIYSQFVFNNRKLITFPGTLHFLKQKKEKKEVSIMDFFGNSDSLFEDNEECIIEKILKKDKFVLTEVHPENVLLGKIILGDGSDDIDSCYTFHDQTKRFKRITDSFMLDLYAEPTFCLKNLIIEDDYMYEQMKNIIEKKAKQSIDLDELKENIKLNIKLILLNETNIPKKLLDIAIKNIEKLKADKNFKKNLSYDTQDFYSKIGITNMKEQSSITIYG